MRVEEAKFWAECLNDLFDKDQPYIVAVKYADTSRGGVRISVEKFRNAIWYAYEFDTNLGAIYWVGEGTYSMLRDLRVEVDSNEQQIRMFGYTGADEGCWRTLKRLDNNHYREFLKWEDAS